MNLSVRKQKKRPLRSDAPLLLRFQKVNEKIILVSTCSSIQFSLFVAHYQESGKHFDPQVVALFRSIQSWEWVILRANYVEADTQHPAWVRMPAKAA